MHNIFCHLTGKHILRLSGIWQKKSASRYNSRPFRQPGQKEEPAAVIALPYGRIFSPTREKDIVNQNRAVYNLEITHKYECWSCERK